MEEISGSWPMSLSITDVTARLLMATIFGAIVGLDREVRRKPAGLRTHMLVALASAALAILSWEIYTEVRERHGSAEADLLRVLEAVVAGVAFLGAGSIIRGRGEVEGITTGASIWLSGAIGIAAGAGYYAVGAITAIIAVIILIVIGWLERFVSTRE